VKHDNRIERTLDHMHDAGIDTLLITDPSAISYYLDYDNDPHERVYMMALRSDGNHRLFFNELFYVSEDLGLPITWFSDADDAMEIIAKYVSEASNLVGVDKNMPARWLLALMDLCPKVAFTLGSSCVDLVRGVKDADEQALMIKASEINDAAMAKVKTLLAENHTEREMADLLLDVYKSMGATDHSFVPIFGYGKNGADPHHDLDDSTLKPGDAIICDMGCVYEGYCSDMTRTFFYKEVSEKQTYVYNLVLKAQEAAEAAIHPGVKLSEIDKIARDMITEGGYGPEFNHRLGHFIGRMCHEAGELSPASDIIAEPGMIFSIEPGVYIEGEFGVRIEDLVMVTDDGIRRLNNFDKSLTVID